MKLAFIINVFREDDFHSGGEKLFYELVSGAIKDGYEVDLYCTKYLYSSAEPQLKLNKLTILGNAKDYKYPSKIEILYEKYKKLINAEDYDHVISENITPVMDIVVLQGHSAQHYLEMENNIFSKALFKLKKQENLKYQKKWIKQGYKKIIVPSETLKNEIIKNFSVDENLFEVIYPGVDMPAKNNFNDLKDTITFGLSAPSFNKKGGYIFLKALGLLKKQGANFKAKIIYPKAHKNPQLKLFLKLYDIENEVEFLSYQQNMDDFYNSIDCIAVPSLMETFGLVVTEAMSKGKITIVGSSCGAKEIIKEGENGFVFEMGQNSAHNLYEKLSFVIQNKDQLKNISKTAINTAKAMSWNNTYKSFKKSL